MRGLVVVAILGFAVSPSFAQCQDKIVVVASRAEENIEVRSDRDNVIFLEELRGAQWTPFSPDAADSAELRYEDSSNAQPSLAAVSTTELKRRGDLQRSGRKANWVVTGLNLTAYNVDGETVNRQCSCRVVRRRVPRRGR